MALKRRPPNSTPRNNPPRPQLLQSRYETARQLGCSVWTVIRMENRGRLTGIKLVPKGRGYNIISEVEALLSNGEAAS
jgi:hypothetical protein